MKRYITKNVQYQTLVFRSYHFLTSELENVGKVTELESRIKNKTRKTCHFFQGRDHKPFLEGFINLYEISVCSPIKIVTD